MAGVPLCRVLLRPAADGAVLGNDDKFIRRTLEAAEVRHPTLIAYLGSPVPMVIGTDLEGMAAETEYASGIPSFGFNTTGQNYYDKGASDVFLRLIRRFAKARTVHEDGKKRANVLGMLALDVGNKGNCGLILDFIRKLGYEINADFAMGLTIAQIEHCGDADINIVVPFRPGCGGVSGKAIWDSRSPPECP